MMTRDWHVTSELGTDTHEILTDAVSRDGGYTLVNDALFEIVTWWAMGERATHWVLRAAPHAGRA